MKSPKIDLLTLPGRRSARLIFVLFASLLLLAMATFALRGASADTLNKFGITEQSRAGKPIEKIAPHAFAPKLAAKSAPFACNNLTVNNLGDGTDATPGNGVCETATGNGICTLRAAIQESNASTSCSPLTISFSANGTITLGSNLPNITRSVTITGNGTANTIISGNNLYRSLNSIQTDGISITIQNLKATNGFVAGSGFGGAIDLDSLGGTLTVNNVELTNGSAGYGGGLNADDGTLNINSCIFSNNTGNTVSAGIWVGSTVTTTLVNCLFTGNSGPAGAVFSNGGILKIYNSTLVGNSASNAAYAAGVRNNGGTFTLYNSIIANNSGGSGDCVSVIGPLDVQRSLIKNGGCGITNGVNGNLTGDPALNPDYTLTSASNAVGTGNNSLIPVGVTTDLAGNARIQQGTVDMGAYESTFAGIVPVLGNYSATTVNLGGQATVTPSAAPTDATNLVAMASSGFNGTFYADPATGVVKVVNAYPAGTYTVTVTSFRIAGSTSKTFTLTVQSGSACATTPLFSSPPNVSVGSPYGPVVGDFNNDGKQDLVIANNSGASVSIRLGDGAGGFTGTTTVSTGANPFAIAVGDFNGDGNQDLAVACTSAGVVSIRLGDGAGNFSGTTNITAGGTSKSVAVGDFNGDGKLDFVTANFGVDTASVRFGDGAGGFTGSTNISVGDGPGQIRVGDFDGDGDLDFATSNQNAGTVSVRLNDGAGNFSGTTEITVGANPEFMALGDFNKDGKLDFVTSNQNAGTLSVRFGDGAGSFTGMTTLTVSASPRQVLAGDFNNDGNPDIAVKQASAETVAYLLGDGVGGFATPVNVSTTGLSGSFLALGDFNGDGRQDFATTGFSAGALAVRLGGCNTAPTITAGAALIRQQGSAGVSDTIATVSDTETSSSNLTVAATTIPTGITVTGITNSSGTVTATVTAACNATVGTNTVVLTVTDGNSGTATANLSVTVTANTAPSVTYGNVSVSAGGSTSNSPTTATDNGSITGYGLQSAGTYSGTISVNPTTGAVSISNAAPVGTHTITIRATDNCGAPSGITDATFTLTVNNTAPTITPASTLIRQRGTAGIVATIATVNDAETAPGSLTVTATTVPSGISVTSISNSNGTVSASVAAGCAAALGNNTVVLTVTDANSGTATANLTVNVIDNNPPTLVYPASSIGLGSSTSINPTTATDNGSITGFSIVSVTPAMTVAPTVNSSGVVSINNAGPFGSHTIIVRATDNCTTTTDASFTLNVGCGSIAITPTSLVNGLTFVTYTATLSATGGGGNYAFTLQSGTLPVGLMLNGNVITGTPTTPGASVFTIRATDDNGCFGERTYTLNIGSTGLMYYPLARPVRLLDTRPGASPNACFQPNAPVAGGNPRTQPARGTCEGLVIPANATTITGHITTVQSGGGFLTLYPSDAPQPAVTNSNYLANEVLNNAFTVGLGAADGAFKLFVSSNTDIVIDVTGYYAPPSAGGLYFHPLPKPIRLLETRQGFTGCQTTGTPLQAATMRTQTGVLTCDGVTIPIGAQALVGNATTTLSQNNGYLTLYPADASQPFTASSNYVAAVNRNAPFTVGLSLNGEFNIYTSATTDLVIDVMGYFSTQASDTNGQGLLFNSLGSPLRLMDTRAGQPACYTPGAPMTGATVYLQDTQIPCTNLTSAARALVGNVSALNAVANGFLTFWPSNAAQPTVATSNYQTGRTFNRHFTVGLGPDIAFKRYTSGTTDLIIDISGFFAP